MEVGTNPYLPAAVIDSSLKILVDSIVVEVVASQEALTPSDCALKTTLTHQAALVRTPGSVAQSIPQAHT